MREIHNPPRNRREAIRNIIISQRAATTAFLEGRMMDFSLETSRGFGISFYSSPFLEYGEAARIRHRVMDKLFQKNSESEGEFPKEFYIQMTKNSRNSYPIRAQQDLLLVGAAA